MLSRRYPEATDSEWIVGCSDWIVVYGVIPVQQFFQGGGLCVQAHNTSGKGTAMRQVGVSNRASALIAFKEASDALDIDLETAGGTQHCARPPYDA